MTHLADAFLPAMFAVVHNFQGCAQCLDNAAATPPETQVAYRHAILLLISTAVLLFLAGVALLRRNR